METSSLQLMMFVVRDRHMQSDAPAVECFSCCVFGCSIYSCTRLYESHVTCVRAAPDISRVSVSHVLSSRTFKVRLSGSARPSPLQLSDREGLQRILSDPEGLQRILRQCSLLESYARLSMAEFSRGSYGSISSGLVPD